MHSEVNRFSSRSVSSKNRASQKNHLTFLKKYYIIFIESEKWKMNKKIKKKTGDELQGFLMWRNRGSVVAPKKGKGSFKRKAKHKNKEY